VLYIAGAPLSFSARAVKQDTANPNEASFTERPSSMEARPCSTAWLGIMTEPTPDYPPPLVRSVQRAIPFCKPVIVTGATVTHFEVIARDRHDRSNSVVITTDGIVTWPAKREATDK
jgi:hypothetical protein